MNRFLTKFGVVEEIRSEKPKISSDQWDVLTPLLQLEKTPEEEMFSSESVETLMDLLEYLPKQAHACYAFTDVTGSTTDWLTANLQQNLEDRVSEQIVYCQSYLDLGNQHKAVAEIEIID